MSAARFDRATELQDFGPDLQGSDEPSLRACVVFDNGPSARSAKRLLRRISPNESLETTLLRLELDLTPAKRNLTASIASESDLLVFAIAHTAELPAFARAWFHLWITQCDETRDRAVVAFQTGASSPASGAPWITFLKRFAEGANIAFFCGSELGCSESHRPRLRLPAAALPPAHFPLVLSRAEKLWRDRKQAAPLSG